MKYKYQEFLVSQIDDLKLWYILPDDFWDEVMEKLEEAYSEGLVDGRSFDGPR